MDDGDADGLPSVLKTGEVASSEPRHINIVLVGHTGNGKSATGNSILGGRPFISMPSASSVSCTCELQSKQLADGRTINVIDTHGFGDIVTEHELLINEVTKCFELAKNEIHAFLLVVSVRSRFSKEEAAAIRNLKLILGSNVVNYVIIVFTGGDDLDDQMKTLDDYLGHDCPAPLKEIISECGERSILFDNRTKNEKENLEQVRQVIALIDMMIHKNGGAPFKNDLYELKKENEEMKRKIKIVNSGRDNWRKSVQAIQSQGGHQSEAANKLEQPHLNCQGKDTTEELEKNKSRNFWDIFIQSFRLGRNITNDTQ